MNGETPAPPGASGGRNLNNLSAHRTGLEGALGAVEDRLAALEEPETPKSQNPLRRIGGLFQRGREEKLEKGEGKSWRESLGDRVKSARERVGTNLNNLKEGLQNFPNTPFGKTALRFVGEIIGYRIAGKDIGKVAQAALVAKYAAMYFIYKTGEQIAKLGKSTWEHKGDIAVGAVTGAALRTVLITAGWEAYLAKVVASGGVAAIRKGWAELESYDKPEGLKARLNLVSRIKALTPEQRKQLARKTAVAGVFGAAGSLLGMEFMEHTGLGDYLHQAMEAGLDKASELIVNRPEVNLPEFNLPKPDITLPKVDLPKPPEINLPTVEFPQFKAPDIQLPKVDLPQIPKVDLSEINLPQFQNPLDNLRPPGADLVQPPAEGPTPFPEVEARAEPVPMPQGIPTPGIPEQTVAPTLETPLAPEVIPPEVTPPVVQEVGTTVLGPEIAGPEAQVPATPAEIPQSVPEPTGPTISEQPPAIGQAPLAEEVTVEGSQVEPGAETPPPAVSLVDEVIKNLPSEMPTPPTGGWGVSENLLKQINPNLNYTPGDIMEVDKILCQMNGVSVPEWGIEGEIDHRRLPASFEFKITDEVKDALKNVSAKAASR